MLAMTAGQTGQAAVLGLQKTGQTLDRCFAVNTGQCTRQGNAILQRIACTGWRLRPVTQHLPLTLGIADQVGAVKNQQGAFQLRGTIRGGKQIAGMGKHQLWWQQAFVDHAAFAIEIVKQVLKQAAALLQTGFQPFPLLGTDDPGQAVELPGTQLTRIILVGIEGHTVFMQQVLGFFTAADQHLWSQRSKFFQQV